MGKGTDKFVNNTKNLFDNQFKFLNRHLGEPLAQLLDIPVKIILSPFTLLSDISGSAPRGFGIPEFISKLSYSTIFVSLFNWDFESFSFSVVIKLNGGFQ